MAAETVLVVGAGQAGGWAAATLRDAGFEGRVALVGEEAHLPYERPPLSKGVLAGKASAESCRIKAEEDYRAMGVELRLGERAAAIDAVGRRLVLASGEALAYDKLVLATGSRVRRLPVPGAELPGVFYLRTLDDALALRARLGPGVRVALVGGGYIGLEVAATATELGCEVTVIEALPQVMARVVPEEISAEIARRHRARGVVIETGLQVAGFEAAGAALRVLCQDGRGIEADVVVIGIGIVPNAELAEAAGIETDDGVLVDEFGRSSDPRIYAAGDVARHYNPGLGRHLRLESWQNAQNQAIATARSVCGRGEAYAEVPWFWSQQYDMNIQMVGFPEGWDRVLFRGERTAERFSAFCLSDGLVVAAVAVNNPRDIRFARTFIGERTRVDPAQLADPGMPLKSISRGSA